jgi:integrase
MKEKVMNIVPIKLTTRDTSGMSLFVANTNIQDTITETKSFKATGTYKIQLRVQVTKDCKKYQKKVVKTFNPKQTLLQAINIMSALRESIKEDLRDGTIIKQRATKVDQTKPITLNMAFDTMIEQKRNTLKPKTIKSYESFYNMWLRNGVGTQYIVDITKEQLQGVVNKIIKIRAARTAKTLKEVLNPTFKQYLHLGIIQSNPIELLEFKKFYNVQNPDLTDEQIKSLYQAIYEYEIEPYRSIFIWLSTGRRVNEVLTLKWENINLDKKIFTITAEDNKAGRQMQYEIDDDLLETLNNIEIRDKGYVFHSIKDKDKKMHNDTIKRHWIHILEGAGLENIRIHDLRHIVGLKLVNAGFSLEVIASVLGHTTTSITKRYSNVRTKTAADALSQFKDMVK